MKLFKRLFKRKKKEEVKQEECWYNNVHELEQKPGQEYIEGAALCGENQHFYSSTQQAAKHQG
jgi:hypothetical protein